jgi:hypothetical protein
MAVKLEVDGTNWAGEKYLEWQKKLTLEERLKGTQEALKV